MKRNARAFGINRRVLLSTAVLLSTPPLLRIASTLAQDASKLLTAWNDGPAKQAITEFVHATTDQSSPKFVQSEERIATFDQDGTLWVEHPMYTQVVYCFERVPAVVGAETGTQRPRALQNRTLWRPRSYGQAVVA